MAELLSDVHSKKYHFHARTIAELYRYLQATMVEGGMIEQNYTEFYLKFLFRFLSQPSIILTYSRSQKSLLCHLNHNSTIKNLNTTLPQSSHKLTIWTNVAQSKNLAHFSTPHAPNLKMWEKYMITVTISQDYYKQ